MAYIVTDGCVKCKYTDCVAVCPVDCFYEGENMLVIHPDECIDCGACEPECPTTAILEESEVPEKDQVYVGINAFFSGATGLGDIDTSDWPEHLLRGAEALSEPWPNIVEQKESLPGAEEAEKESDKLQYLSPNPPAGGND